MNKDLFKFLTDLEVNNNREWFAENKKQYESVRKSVVDFLGTLIDNINAFDPSIGPLDPSKSLYRIYRDTRFSLNKDPYKNNFGSIIVPEEYRRSWEYPGYYLHLQNNGSFVSMGIYMPSSATVKNIRCAIDEDFENFLEIVKPLEKTFSSIIREEDSLKRVPTGYDKDNPAADYLKLKNFYVFRTFSNKEVMEKDFMDKITGLFKESFDFKKWLIKAIEG